MDKMKIWLNKMMHYLMLSCHQATLLMTKNEYQKLSLTENMQLKMHLMGCKFCRAFDKQNKILTDKINKIHTHPVDLELHPEKKIAIQQSLDNLNDKDQS